MTQQSRRVWFSRMRTAPLALMLATAAVGAAAQPAEGQDVVSASGFATLGAAVSDRSYRYQRFIDDNVRIRRDSVAGIQFDAAVTHEIGVTVQVKAAADGNDDQGYEPSIPWAFASWRPNNEWLVRAGKWRIPFNLYSETADIGTTHDFARLPTELYSLTPSTDAVGMFVSRMWNLNEGELSLEGYAGRRKNSLRVWVRDDTDTLDPSAYFNRLEFTGAGLVLSYRDQTRFLRLGLHTYAVENDNGRPFATDYPFVTVRPGVGYYQITNLQRGPGVQTQQTLHNTTLRAGADIALPDHWRAIGEMHLSLPLRTDATTRTTRGYLAILRRFGKLTPYVSGAFVRSSKTRLDSYEAVNGNRVPVTVPGAAALNASQRVGADLLNAYDQTSIAAGASLALSERLKVKGELLRTRVGRVSQLVDAPPNSDIRHTNIHVLSLSISAVF